MVNNRWSAAEATVKTFLKQNCNFDICGRDANNTRNSASNAGSNHSLRQLSFDAQDDINKETSIEKRREKTRVRTSPSFFDRPKIGLVK